MKTFLFYDIETSGLNPAFDQILTFASIRTDLEFNEIERELITVCLRKDIVPSPKAFLTHGLTYQELELGISEYQAALKIHKIFNTAGTISLGYNSLSFDDEFLRFLFYRNLLDPYTHQYSNGCSRMDILPLTVIYKLFHPGILKWPEVDGKTKLKLELISSENNFKISGRAHEAMSDVEAVIELSKRMFSKRDIWRYCLDFFNKSKDDIRIRNIRPDFQVDGKQFKICIMVSIAFGPDSNYMAPVIHIGQSAAYKNQSLWLRLDIDDNPALNSSIDLKETFVLRKRDADGQIILPALERFWDKLPLSSQKSAKANMSGILQNKLRFFELIQYHRDYKYPYIPDLDSDAALYQDGFFSRQEKRESEFFHKFLKSADHDDANDEILEKIRSPRIKKLANRILHRMSHHKPFEIKEMENCLGLNRLRSSEKEEQIIGYKNDTKFNCEQGLRELNDTLKETENPSEDTKEMLQWLKDYIKSF